MPNNRVPPANPAGELPELTNRVKPLRGEQVRHSFAAMLVPVVDSIRQLNTVFGMRPYRVFLVHLQWSGAVRGAGQPVEVARTEILPTPRLDLGGTSSVLKAAGLTEEGGIRVREISAKYAEDDLLGKTPDLIDPSKPLTSRKNVEFLWEVVEDRVQDPTGRRRRFYPDGPPVMVSGGLGWEIGLIRQDWDNRRSGATIPRGFL